MLLQYLMIAIINKLINKISIILMVMMFLMPIITSILILTRSIFGIGSISIQELVMYFHATIFMLGIAYTTKHNRHVSIDIFYNSFSTKAKERIIKFRSDPGKRLKENEKQKSFLIIFLYTG